MIDAGVGRLLVAGLHQSIADLLPSRLEFYEAWLNPLSLRDGRIGLAPLAAVLSFLRQEGEIYRDVTARAGEYAADWMIEDLPSTDRFVIRAAPAWLRTRLVLRLTRRLVRGTYGGSRALVRWERGGAAVIDVRASPFCQVRERASYPMCDFYAAGFRRLAELFSVHVDVSVGTCRARGDAACVLRMVMRATAPSAPSGSPAEN